LINTNESAVVADAKNFRENTPETNRNKNCPEFHTDGEMALLLVAYRCSCLFYTPLILTARTPQNLQEKDFKCTQLRAVADLWFRPCLVWTRLSLTPITSMLRQMHGVLNID
jgi:hypothetical protein